MPKRTQEHVLAPVGDDTPFLPSVTFDIANPDRKLCNVLELHVDRVPSRVFLMESNNSIGELVDGEKKIWSHPFHRCVLLVLFLKDGKPQIACVTLLSEVDIIEKFYKYKKNKWEKSKKRYTSKIDKLRVAPSLLKNITLDISSSREGEDYRVFKTDKGGIMTLLYVPNKDTFVTKVLDPPETAWEYTGNTTCFLVEVYIKGDKKFLTFYRREFGIILFSRFEQVNHKWNPIKSGEFCAKLSNFMGRSVSIQGECISYTDWVRRLGLRL